MICEWQAMLQSIVCLVRAFYHRGMDTKFDLISMFHVWLQKLLSLWYLLTIVSRVRNKYGHWIIIFILYCARLFGLHLIIDIAPTLFHMHRKLGYEMIRIRCFSLLFGPHFPVSQCDSIVFGIVFLSQIRWKVYNGIELHVILKLLPVYRYVTLVNITSKCVWLRLRKRQGQMILPTTHHPLWLNENVRHSYLIKTRNIALLFHLNWNERQEP